MEIVSGKIGFCIQEDDRIIQLGLKKETYEIIMEMLTIATKDSPFIKMSKEYDLVRVVDVKRGAKNGKKI